MREVIARAVLTYRGDDPDASLGGDGRNTLWMEYAETELPVILAAISEAGSVIVPKEPTEAMIQAAHIDYRKSTLALGHNLPDIYRAMIEASQESE